MNIPNYPRGWCLVPGANAARPAAVPVRYRTEELDRFTLFHDDSLPLLRAASNGAQIRLLGLVFNPFENALSGQEIVDLLAKLLARSETEFLDYLDNLSGRYFIIAAARGQDRIYPDACAVRSVFHARKSGATCCGSAAPLVAEVAGCGLDQEAVRFTQTREHLTGTQSLPGHQTLYDGVTFLTSNTRLDLRTGEVDRFWPRAPIVPIPDPTGTLLTLMRTIMKRLADEGRAMFSLTAGMDSRLAVASARDLTDRVEFFTYWEDFSGLNYRDSDRDVAKKVAAQLGLVHHVYDLGNVDPMPEEFFEKWSRAMSGMGIRMRGRMAWGLFNQFPHGGIHVRSNVSEVGRCFYRKMGVGSEVPDVKTLAELYGRRPADPFVINAWRAFKDRSSYEIESLHGRDFYDLFYWEARAPAFLGFIFGGDDYFCETVIPFANRRLLDIFLSYSREERMRDRTHLTLLEKMWPEAMQEPFNPFERRDKWLRYALPPQARWLARTVRKKLRL